MRLLTLLLLMVSGCSYPIEYQGGDMYSCRGPIMINTNDSPDGWDQECYWELGRKDSCAVVVIQYKVNGMYTVICREVE